jgi:hypothetical protein
MTDLHASSPRWLAVPEVLRGLFIIHVLSPVHRDGPPIAYNLNLTETDDPRVARGFGYIGLIS